ncbi:MAG: Calx-beta domain-containing protein, partial [Chitinophagaceae bacterium]
MLIISTFLLISKQERNLGGTAVRTWTGTNSNVVAIAALPDISIADMRIVEGNAGQIIAQVMVSISQVSSGPVTVVYSTRNGTALADTDYVAAKGSIIFAPGDMMKRINVSIIGELI